MRTPEPGSYTYQAGPATGAITLHAWLSRWLDARTNRSAGTDRSMAKHLYDFAHGLIRRQGL